MAYIDAPSTIDLTFKHPQGVTSNITLTERSSAVTFSHSWITYSYGAFSTTTGQAATMQITPSYTVYYTIQEIVDFDIIVSLGQIK